MASKTLTVTEFLDDCSFTPYQMWVCFLCFLVTVLDGFDLTIIGVALPKIAEHLKSEPKALGLAVGAGQIGPLIGAVVLGMLADRWGRKRMLVLSALIFGVFTVLCAYITNVEQLAIYRFFAGIGLGGGIPNALAFGSEFSPSRNRAMVATMMYVGMPFGSTVGGLSAAYLIPAFGWQSLFLVAGAVPVALAVVLALVMPESLEVLVRLGADKSRIRKIASRIAPTVMADPALELRVSGVAPPGAPLKNLFTEGRAVTTVLLWAVFFLSFYLIWMLFSWAPTLLKQTGASVQQYSLAFACLHFGAVLAAIFIGRLMDRFAPTQTLKYIFIIAFFAYLGFGYSAGSTFIVVAMASVCCGLFVGGGNCGIMGLSAVSYPPSMRATGIGWAYAVGKLGTLLAPIVGGFMISAQWSVFHICLVTGVLALIASGVCIILQKYTAANANAKASVTSPAVAPAPSAAS